LSCSRGECANGIALDERKEEVGLPHLAQKRLAAILDRIFTQRHRQFGQSNTGSLLSAAMRARGKTPD